MKTLPFATIANYVDILKREIYPVKIMVENGKIKHVEKLSSFGLSGLNFVLPGFIDAHVHIESSMLVPSEFARLAVVHGTVATVSDPHEIANVCGISGVKYMIENAKQVPFKFFFGAPSCVPATRFETAGACLSSDAVSELLQNKEIYYLSEMMNFPGVLEREEEVMKKIVAAQNLHKPVDGHAPGLRGKNAKNYIDAGISTDHECFTKEEALEKLKLGMKIIIREGSAAKNFDELVDLLDEHYNSMMFCSDDKHPDSLVEGHINELCRIAVARKIDVFKVLQAACINPVHHYKLNVGLLKEEDDDADFIVVEDLINFKVLKTYIKGELVAENGKTLISRTPVNLINNFHCDEITRVQLEVNYNDEQEIDVIEALDGQLITNKRTIKPKIKDGLIISDIENDVLKIAVLNRYENTHVAKAFIKNFGLEQGAIASSVAHDSHNIIAVGADDESIAKAVNIIIQKKGGISCVSNSEERVLALPVAGLMSDKDGYEVAALYTAIDQMAKKLGSKLSAPFMTLSFMALLVIPALKISDKGLFDGINFKLLG